MPADALDRDVELWLATNLLRGVSVESLHASLAERGVPRAAVDDAVAAIRASPAFEAATPFVEDARRLQMLIRRDEALLRSVPAARGVARIETLDVEDFLLRHVAESVPAVVVGAARALRAFEAWSWRGLRERHGNARMRVTKKAPYEGARPSPFSPTVESTFGELIDHALSHVATPADPGLYLVATEPVLQGALSALQDDVDPDLRLFDARYLIERAYLWIGPRGTRTEFHHDVNPVVMFQIRGRKRVRLARANDAVMLDAATSTVSELQWDDRRLADAFVREAVIEEGDALFLPVGTWHAVEALEPSITLSLSRLVTGDVPRLRLDGTV